MSGEFRSTKPLAATNWGWTSWRVACCRIGPAKCSISTTASPDGFFPRRKPRRSSRKPRPPWAKRRERGAGPRSISRNRRRPMNDNAPLFEEMLAAYPADKREMARRVYDRFANGDATEFFTQLFLLLDVYANYAKRIPQAVSETNQSTLASLKKVREEIGLLAQIVEKRSVEMGNAAEDTSTLCLETQEKAEAAAQRLEKLTQDMASKVDTEAIVESIRASINAGIRAEVILPFVQRTEELAKEVLPTLEKIRDASDEAARVWPQRIWKMALAGGLVFG